MTNKELLEGMSFIDDKYLDISYIEPPRKKVRYGALITFIGSVIYILQSIIKMPKY